MRPGCPPESGSETDLCIAWPVLGSVDGERCEAGLATNGLRVLRIVGVVPAR